MPRQARLLKNKRNSIRGSMILIWKNFKKVVMDQERNLSLRKEKLSSEKLLNPLSVKKKKKSTRPAMR